MARNGIDHRLVAKVCSMSITQRFGFSRNLQDETWDDNLEEFIARVVYNSRLGFGVTVAAMTLTERFQEAILECEDEFYKASIEVARRVFLICYIIAAKIMFKNQFTMVFWKKVTEREYDCSDLAKMERRFYRTLNWTDDDTIDEDAFVRQFKNITESYQDLVKTYTLPASPMPTFQPTRRNQRTRVRSNRSDMKTEYGVEEIPSLDEEDEALLARAMELPMPCTTRQRAPRGFGMSFFGFGFDSHQRS